MLNIGLEFAPGTTDDCRHLVGRLFTPGQILDAYRAAREKLMTGDLVLVVSEVDPSGFDARTRGAYVQELKRGLGGKPMPPFVRGLVDKSAHSIVKLPFESEAMWLVVTRGAAAIPVMCVIFMTPYEVDTSQAN